LVASYGIAASVSGFAGGFVLDRFDRKHALTVLYFGFGVATLACALAPTHGALMLARVAAGAFGGLAGSMVSAMVGDIVPPTRRGRAMSIVMSAFPLASVLGVPLGLYVAARSNWHAPFFLLAACSAVILVVALFALPPIKTAVHGHQPLRQMREILSHGIHRRAFAVGMVLVMAGGMLIPFIAPSFIANLGLDAAVGLPTTYMVGGIATAVSTPLIGWLSDRFDRLKRDRRGPHHHAARTYLRRRCVVDDGPVHGYDVGPIFPRHDDDHERSQRALSRRIHERECRAATGRERRGDGTRRRVHHPCG
jgi:predicted MFS family arabinose efflux permease